MLIRENLTKHTKISTVFSFLLCVIVTLTSCAQIEEIGEQLTPSADTENLFPDRKSERRSGEQSISGDSELFNEDAEQSTITSSEDENNYPEERISEQTNGTPTPQLALQASFEPSENDRFNIGDTIWMIIKSRNAESLKIQLRNLRTGNITSVYDGVYKEIHEFDSSVLAPDKYEITYQVFGSGLVVNRKILINMYNCEVVNSYPNLDIICQRMAFMSNAVYDIDSIGYELHWNDETWEVVANRTITIEKMEKFKKIIPLEYRELIKRIGADKCRFAILKKENGNEIIIVFRGMKLRENLDDVVAYFTSHLAGLKSVDNAQAEVVFNCVYGEEFKEYLTNKDYNIYITGHSLGGYLAQMAYKFILEKRSYYPNGETINATIKNVVTFNSVGVPQYVENDSLLNNGNENKVLNLQIRRDIARYYSLGADLTWIGKTYVFDIHEHFTTGKRSVISIEAHDIKWFLNTGIE